MAHVEKFSKTQVGQLFAHYERKKDKNGEHRKYGNQEINLKKTFKNYNLCPDNGLSQIDRYHQRLSQVKCLNRDDVKTMCNWVVTLPESFKQEDDNVKREFFKASYDFLENRYGKNNVISAFVHMDETTPHMHFAFIPVAIDKKKGHEKVSAKEVLTRTELLTFHKDLKFYLDEKLGRDVDVLNGATKDGNLTIAELKNRNKELESIERSISEKKSEIKKLDKKMELVENRALNYRFKKIPRTGVPFSKDKIIVSEKDLTELEKIAKTNSVMKNEVAEARKIISERDNIIKTAQNTAKSIIESAKQEGIKERLDRISEVKTLREKLKFFEDIWSVIPDTLKRHLNALRGVQNKKEVLRDNRKDKKREIEL